MRTHLDLFSGIGGFALAANWAGFTTVGFVEYEDFPKRLLSKRFPGVPIFGDIHDFDGTPFRGVDLITGGFPCQPFSAAGKQRGTEDDRWLWKEMLRVIIEAQPTWVLAENVAGIINMALDEVLADLEAQDYATATVILPACSQNALHRRDRVWIIAKSLADTKGNRTFCATEGSGCNRSSEDEKAWMPFTSDTSGASKALAHSKCQSVRDQGSGQDASETSSSKGELRERQQIWSDSGECSKDVAHSEQQRLQGHVEQQTESSDAPSGCSTDTTVAHSDSQRGCSRDSQRQDAEDAWESPRSTQHGTGKFVGRLGGSLDGIPEGLDFPRRWGDGSWEDGIPRVTTQKKGRTQRLKALGNSILPQVAYEIIRHFD